MSDTQSCYDPAYWCPECEEPTRMNQGYRPNEWECPNCGLLWDSNTNEPLKFDPTDTGQYRFYSQEGHDVEY